MAVLMLNEQEYSGFSNSADNVTFNSGGISLTSDNVQGAIEEVNNNLTANNQQFKFSYSNGKYGYMNGSTFVPFKNPIGSKSITANGTYDVTDYASAVVNVTSTGNSDGLFMGDVDLMTTWVRDSTYATNNFGRSGASMYASGGFGTFTTSDYIDLSQYSTLWCVASKAKEDESYGCKLSISLIDTSGKSTQVYYQVNQLSNTDINISVSSYTGKYKIQIYFYSAMNTHGISITHMALKK